MMFLFLYLSGFAACVLLMMQSLGINNRFAKMICEVSKKTSCSNVLNSKGAKLFDLIGWSEVGIIYFTGCLLSIVFVPLSLPLLFWLNIFSLPYTIWSVIYQHYIVKQWCVLCLIVQLIFWLLLFTFIFNKVNLYPLNMEMYTIINSFICFIIPSLCLWFITPVLDKSIQFKSLQYYYNKIKANKTIFSTLLKEQEILELDSLARSLSIGHKNAPLTITIVSNPYCGHCATMHKRLVIFLEKHPNDFRVEFVFVGDHFMENTIKFLIAAYFQFGETKITKVYNDWFEKNDKILDSYHIDNITSQDVHIVYLAQKKWLENKEVAGTPTIYLNSCKLPEGYILEDIRHFI